MSVSALKDSLDRAAVVERRREEAARRRKAARRDYLTAVKRVAPAFQGPRLSSDEAVWRIAF